MIEFYVGITNTLLFTILAIHYFTYILYLIDKFIYRYSMVTWPLVHYYVINYCAYWYFNYSMALMANICSFESDKMDQCLIVYWTYDDSQFNYEIRLHLYKHQMDGSSAFSILFRYQSITLLTYFTKIQRSNELNEVTNFLSRIKLKMSNNLFRMQTLN